MSATTEEPKTDPPIPEGWMKMEHPFVRERGDQFWDTISRDWHRTAFDGTETVEKEFQTIYIRQITAAGSPTKPPAPKPPLGVMPRKAYDFQTEYQRAKELVRAIHERLEFQEEHPHEVLRVDLLKEWSSELNLRFNRIQ